jgi:heat shock protein HtpX
MTDIVLLNYLIVGLFVLWPLTLIRRGLPRLRPGAGVQLYELEENEAEYARRYWTRWAFIWLNVLLFAYLIIHVLGSEPLAEGIQEVPFSALLSDGLVGFFVVTLAVTVIRYRLEVRFAAEHPEFANAPLPLMERLSLLAGVGMLLLAMVIGLQFKSVWACYACLGAGLVALTVRRKLYEKSMLSRQTLVERDSGLGEKIAELGERFSFVPRRTIEYQSLIANGGVFANGVVMVTRALRLILTDDQLAAVLAHEFSHARDQDMKRIKIANALLTICMAAIASISLLLMVMRHYDLWFLLPLLVSSMTTGATVGMMVRGRIWRALERKCDAAAADQGYGPDLAEGLVRLHRYQGLPARWKGLDRWILTHPSLEDRVRALRGGGILPIP